MTWSLAWRRAGADRRGDPHTRAGDGAGSLQGRERSARDSMAHRQREHLYGPRDCDRRGALWPGPYHHACVQRGIDRTRGGLPSHAPPGLGRRRRPDERACCLGAVAPLDRGLQHGGPALDPQHAEAARVPTAPRHNNGEAVRLGYLVSLTNRGALNARGVNRCRPGILTSRRSEDIASSTSQASDAVCLVTTAVSEQYGRTPRTVSPRRPAGERISSERLVVSPEQAASVAEVRSRTPRR